jgi:hypothetical protein
MVPLNIMTFKNQYVIVESITGTALDTLFGDFFFIRGYHFVELKFDMETGSNSK